MKAKLILLAGYCASGKSTFAGMLSRQLSVPSFMKDTVKEILGEEIGFANREENLKLSAATFRLLVHMAEKLLSVGMPAILESNFRPSEAPAIQELLERTGSDCLTYRFTGDMATLHRRFAERESTSERHFVHKSGGVPNLEGFRQSMEYLGEFRVTGEVVEVDATSFEAVDYNALIRRAKSFLTE